MKAKIIIDTEKNESVLFNAVRDNGGKGIEASKLADRLRVLIENDQ